MSEFTDDVLNELQLHITEAVVKEVIAAFREHVLVEFAASDWTRANILYATGLKSNQICAAYLARALMWLDTEQNKQRKQVVDKALAQRVITDEEMIGLLNATCDLAPPRSVPQNK